MERLVFDKNISHNAMEISNHISRYGVIEGYVEGKCVLDIACGEGWGSYVMSKFWGAARVHGIDCSHQTIAAAKKNFSLSNIRWSVMDADSLSLSDFDETYDIIVSIETIEHLKDPQHFLKTIRHLIRPGGLIVISCPNDRWFYGPGQSKNPNHLHTFSFEEFKQLSEDELGPADQFLLGAKTDGFAAVSTQRFGDIPKDIIGGLNQIGGNRAIEVAPSLDMKVDEDQALYFMGVWGHQVSLSNYTVTPIDPEKRFPLDHLRPLGVSRDGPIKKITLVADTPGWAYDNISQNIRKYLGDIFEINIIYVVNYKDFTEFFIDVFCRNDADFIHFFWREYLFAMLKGICVDALKKYIHPTRAMECFSQKIITMSVYDHLLLNDFEVNERQHLMAVCDAYSVCSKKLLDIYTHKFHVGPDVIIEDGVDTEIFEPANLERFSKNEKELVVGWAGNSQWHLTKKEDPKGLHTILKPAIQLLKAKGLQVKGVYADVSEKKRPRSLMPEYYSSIDVLVCASSIEGTPNPVLEAMACGVPIISTDVGIVPQLFGPEQQKFILKRRSVEEMANRLQQFIEDRSILIRLSKENLDKIKNWTWQHHMTRWMLLFKRASYRYDSRAIYRKQRLLLSYLYQLPVKKNNDLSGFIRKVAFRIYPDSIFWKKVKAKLLKPFRSRWH